MTNLAHICIDADGTRRTESLREHLEATSALAERFASKIGYPQTARLVAQNHDLGKASREFQRYLAESAGDSEEDPDDNAPAHRARRARGPDHSTAGARNLAETVVPAPKGDISSSFGAFLAYAVAGHHAGLPDGKIGGSNESSLESRLSGKSIPEWKRFAEATLPPEIFEKILPGSERFKKIYKEILSLLGNRDGFKISFGIRMIFSCLTDADFLATENFMNAGNAQLRGGVPADTIPQLEKRLAAYLKKFDGNASPIGKIRNEIRADCLAAAELPPGLFTLTVPTGGGKTLSSLAFALKHARLHGLERVIYVIPYTSIIEQNAAVFADALGGENVLEHHCNAEFDDDAGNDDTRKKLAAENWNAPIVATTAVQFYESLFSHKPSRCRKLHNIAKSVVILDEAQTLPIPFLKPCLRAIDELAQNYGTTVVLCTATQPAVDSEKLSGGLRGNAHKIREIISPNRNLHERLRRVSVSKIAGTLDDDALAEKILRERRTLAIVNTRRHARALFEKLQSCVPDAERSGLFHLSAQMCPAHRRDILNAIKSRLGENAPCRVVSTQLIEAGVDIDFPCVFRAAAGIDSIAQSAGRCNREGKIGGNGGRVFIFEPKTPAPPGFLRTAAECGKEALATVGADPISHKTVSKYFDLVYWKKSESGELDREKILSDLLIYQNDALTFKFRTCGEKFKLIDDNQKTILVPYGNAGEALCERLRAAFDPAEQKLLSRKLRQYAVSVPEPVFAQAIAAGTATIVHDRFAVLENAAMNYSQDVGIFLRDGGLDVFSCI